MKDAGDKVAKSFFAVLIKNVLKIPNRLKK